MPAIDHILVTKLTEIAAGAAAMLARVDPAKVARRVKDGGSPVTAADEAAEAFILENLAEVLPGTPVVSEEAYAHGRAPAPAACFALVDALDGTREFIAGGGDFTVNIALVTDGEPRLGVIAAPALGFAWRGIVGDCAERLRIVPSSDGPRLSDAARITTRRAPASGLVATMSRSHFDRDSAAFLARLNVVERMPCGSSLKFCRIAEGAADVYPRLAPTSEWDIAAGHAILSAAGGVVTARDGSTLAYGRVANKYIVPGFVAWGDCDAARAAPGLASRA